MTVAKRSVYQDFLAIRVPLWRSSSNRWSRPGFPEWKDSETGDSFVENVPAGIEEMIVGKVEIALRPMEKKLYCMVKDNGIGMNAEKLRSLWADIKAEEPQETNIAIRNIYQRLRFYYGEDFHLLIESAEREGTTITLIIPVGGYACTK